MAIHTPERLADESADEYRARRAASAAAIVQPQRRRDQQRMSKLHPLRDEHGAFTLIGCPYSLDGIKAGPHEHEIAGSTDGFYVVRRKWLGGVSAQRGF